MPSGPRPDPSPQAAEWRDGQGRRLVDYPRPSVAVDVAVLTVAPLDGLGATETGLPPRRGRSDPERWALAVVVHERELDGDVGGPGRWSLPGAFVHERERLADAVLRALRSKCGISGLRPHQLHVFDDPDRDPRGWVLSVAHADVMPYERIAPVLDERPDVRLLPIPFAGEQENGAGSARASASSSSAVPGSPSGSSSTALPRSPVGSSWTSPTQYPPVRPRVDRSRPELAALAFDHREIIEAAVAEMQESYARGPDPAGLLAEPFTLLQLRLLHEAVLGQGLQKDTFRRHVERRLHALDAYTTGTVGRPAQLYARLAETGR